MNMEQYNRIKKLQKRYSETNVAKGEVLSKSSVKKINKKYYATQHRRRVDTVLSNVRNKDSIKEEVHHIVSEVYENGNLKQLCGNCEEEQIIAVIIIYVQKTRNHQYRVDRNSLWTQYSITWQKYSLILGRLLQKTRENAPLK